MRLEFTILWFENQLRELESQLGELESHIRTAGFIPSIVIKPDADDLDELSRRQENFHAFDLVVVDWDLDGEVKGDEVAQRVRRRFGFTDILFYSGIGPNALREKVHEKAIDGVYCVHRRNLIGRLTELIDEIVAGLSRLEAMRGLAMSVVGRCDTELRLLISNAVASVDAEVRHSVMAHLDEMVRNSLDTGRERYEKCENLDERLASFAVTSFHLWKLALRLTKGKEDLVAQRNILKRYDPEVIAPRNTLGHAVETETENGWEIEVKSGNPMTRADFPRLRKNFALHLENVRSIRAAFVVNRDEEAE